MTHYRCEDCGNEYEERIIKHPYDPLNLMAVDESCPACEGEGIPLVRCGVCREWLLPTEFVFDGSTAPLEEIADGDICVTCYREVQRRVA